jgi:hypothetical protein
LQENRESRGFRETTPGVPVEFPNADHSGRMCIAFLTSA